MDPTVIIFFLCTIMFFASGVDKILNFQDNVSRTVDKAGVNSILANILIVLAIIIEIVAPLLLMYWAFTGGNKNASIAAALTLAIFTLIATAMFYLPISKHYYAFLSNTTTFGCMLLIAYVIKNK
jgi:uncharacterized membrane protein YphA (DoxX/SURF4 family)